MGYFTLCMSEEPLEMVRTALQNLELFEQAQDQKPDYDYLLSFIRKDLQNAINAMVELVKVKYDNPDRAKRLRIRYKNWKGVVRDRTIYPLRISYGSNEYHTEPQWLLVAMDCEEEKFPEKTFAMKDILAFLPKEEKTDEQHQVV